MDETQLVKRIKTGDRSAFDSIYDIYHIPVLRSAYLICGNRQDAEDVMQETFVACWLHIRELKKEESFRYWLFRIMTRIARKTAREHAGLLPDEKIQETADRQQAGRDYGEYDRLLEKNVVEEAMRTLPAEQREVIVLYYYDEMSVREIARTLQIFEGTVKSRLFTARRRLKSAMQHTPKEENHV